MKRLDMRIRYRGHSLDLRLTRGSLTIRGRDGAALPITPCVDGQLFEVVSGSVADAVKLQEDMELVGVADVNGPLRWLSRLGADAGGRSGPVQHGIFTQI